MAVAPDRRPSPHAPDPTGTVPWHRLRLGLPVLLSALVLVLAALASPLGRADAAPAAPAEAPAEADEAPSGLPEVIPSLDDWQAEEGSFTAADDLRVVAGEDSLSRTAEITAEELATVIPGATVADGEARAGDVELMLDEAREELGAEGYELVIDEHMRITAATPVGVFYGTRTVLQLLGQRTELPRGEVVDVPQYEERGVTLCACVINISPEWIDRLLEEMSYLKLNTVVMELKVKVDQYPSTNTWSYYTKDDVAGFVEKAEERGIDVIPEINSPGHMEIWLENLPELQLTNPATGEKDEVRMDITKEESFAFYTALMDEYDDVFTSDYWHMGVDEYMLGSGYENFPQVLEFAHERFGPEATENDVVAWYVNRVNAHVKDAGKTLRIWNDGVITDNDVVDFDTDIIIEHWNNAASSVDPQTFVDWGHDVVNVSNSLYMVRGGYGVDSRGLYEDGWTPTTFFNGEVTDGTEQIRGARLSAWPDNGTPQEAENTTEQRMVEPMRLVAQATWSDSRPWADYDAFLEAMEAVGGSPLADDVERLPVEDGGYLLRDTAGGKRLALGEDGTVALSRDGDPLVLTATEDDYYVLRTGDDRCLDVSREGTIRLTVPVQIGAEARIADCSGTTVQKWQLRSDEGGYALTNAATQQRLVVSDGLEGFPIAGRSETGSVPDGQVVQAPADLGDTVWDLEGTVGMTVALDGAAAQPGDQVTASVHLSNDTPQAIEGLTLRVSELPEGWTALPLQTGIDPLTPGASTDLELTLYNILGHSTGTVSFALVDGEGETVAAARADVQGVCADGTLRPAAIADVSSEETEGEPAPNGPAAAAIDGDPATYWHSQWSGTEAQPPHAIVVDLGEVQDVCGLVYTPRSGSGSGASNGQIAGYEVYGATDATGIDDDWGEPLAAGTFPRESGDHTASFAPTEVRYLKLVALSEASGQPWASAAEIAAIGPAAEAPEFSPELTLPVRPVHADAPIEVRATGFAPGEVVEAQLTRRGGGSTDAGTLQADADGELPTELARPEGLQAGRYTLALRGTTTGAEASDDLTLIGR
jgi:hexosaminidase